MKKRNTLKYMGWLLFITGIALFAVNFNYNMHVVDKRGLISEDKSMFCFVIAMIIFLVDARLKEIEKKIDG